MTQQPWEIDRGGMMLRGTSYIPDGSGRRPTVLLLHGFTGQRMESGFIFVRLARRLNERGIAAVTFDFMHSGESDGSFEQMLVSGEIEDAQCVSAWLAVQPFVDRSRMGLVGFSLGGLVAACLCARTDLYQSLALLAPTTVANLCRVARGNTSCDDPAEVVELGPHTLHDRFFSDLKVLDPLGDITRRRRATLLVQGSSDTAVSPAVAQEYLDRLSGANMPARAVHIEGADHAFSRPTWRDKLLEAVCDHFEETLCDG
jgi:dipeptidyl aminopeptidase/acylaminoacyl peptidase